VQSSVPDDVEAAGHVYGVEEVVVAAPVGVALALATGAAVPAVAVAVALERGEAAGAVAAGVVAAATGEDTGEPPPLQAGKVATTNSAADQSDLGVGIVFLLNGARA
jgi:hypothetical protein